MRARYYDPATSRMLSEDSYWGKDSDPLSLNLYTYCGNNPVNFADPTGHFTEGDELKVGSTGDDVKLLQAYLEDYGYLTMPKGVNYGKYGPLTYDAVMKYQKDHKLEQDGIVGNDTWKSMNLLLLSKADAEKGVRVVTIGFCQYLDISIPYIDALYKCELMASKHSQQLGWFKSMVNHNAVWDIKRKGPWETTIGTTYPGSYDAKVILFGSFKTPEELGNIMYGYTGTAADFPAVVLIGGSMYAAGLWDIATDGNARANEMKDHISIMYGINWYKEN